MMFLGLVELTHCYVGIGSGRNFRCCKWENISWETTGTKFPSSSPIFPRTLSLIQNTQPHSCTSPLVWHVWPKEEVEGRKREGSRTISPHQGRDRNTAELESQWEKPSGMWSLLSLCWWTSTEGKNRWRRERQRRLVASLGLAGGQGGSASASREPWPTSLLESLYRTPGQGQEKLPVGWTQRLAQASFSIIAPLEPCCSRLHLPLTGSLTVLYLRTNKFLLSSGPKFPYPWLSSGSNAFNMVDHQSMLWVVIGGLGKLDQALIL